MDALFFLPKGRKELSPFSFFLSGGEDRILILAGNPCWKAGRE
jgi:hypothetical protein